jgi:hypothetical protein
MSMEGWGGGGGSGWGSLGNPPGEAMEDAGKENKIGFDQRFSLQRNNLF